MALVQPGVLLALVALVLAFHQIYKTATLSRKRRSLKQQAGAGTVSWLRRGPFDGGFIRALDLLRSIRQDRFHELVMAYLDQAGNTFCTFVGGTCLHFTTDPENVKTILALDADKWLNAGRKSSGLSTLIGMGIFTNDGHAWKRSRTMLRPSFDRNHVTDMDCFETYLQHLMALIPEQGETVDLSPLFFRLSLDSSTQLLLGESTNSLRQTGRHDFERAFDQGQERCFAYTLTGSFYQWWAWNKAAVKDRDIVRDFVDGVIAKEWSKPKPGNSFLGDLVQQTRDEENIRSELINILVAGRDTTASLLSSLWFVLSTRSDIWQKLQAEVQTLGGRRPTATEIRGLRYVRAAVKETLRLYPPVSINIRQAAEDTILPRGGGPDGSAPILVKPGIPVAWSLYAMHRRKDIFGHDAHEFRAERWLDNVETGEKGLRESWAYVPFNGGPRICLGQQLALNQAIYTTIRLCQEFDGIACRGPPAYQPRVSLVMRNRHGAKVGLWRRAVNDQKALET